MGNKAHLSSLVGMRGSIQEIMAQVKNLYNAAPTYHVLTEDEMEERYGGLGIDFVIDFDFYDSLGDDMPHTVFYLPTRKNNIMLVTEIE